MTRKRLFKILFRWTLFSLLLQCSVFFLLNTYFFKSDGTITSKKIISAKEDNSKVADISIPSEAKDIKMSFDGKYVSYLLDGELKSINVRNGNIIDIPINSHSKLLNYTWLKDRNRIFLTQLDDGLIDLYYYDLSKNHKEKITAEGKKTTNGEITKGNKHTKIESIETSTLTNVTYLNIEKENYKKVYRLDINLEVRPLQLHTDSIGNIKVIPHEDRLIFEDKNNNDIYATSPNKKITKGKDTKYSLLSVDNNDIIYIGILNEDNNISEIKYGTLEDDFSNWKSISLNAPINKSNIIINYVGQILINNENEHFLLDLTNNKKYKYNGIFIEAYTDGFAFIEDGKFKEKLFK